MLNVLKGIKSVRFYKSASCKRVYVNMRAIGSDRLEFPGGVEMRQSKGLPVRPRGPRTYHYKVWRFQFGTLFCSNLHKI